MILSSYIGIHRVLGKRPVFPVHDRTHEKTAEKDGESKIKPPGRLVCSAAQDGPRRCAFGNGLHAAKADKINAKIFKRGGRVRPGGLRLRRNLDIALACLYHTALSPMLFNSFTFLFFFLIVFTLYLLLVPRSQNRMLLAASYIFYGSWDYRFLALLLFSTSVDYFASQKIEAAPDEKTRRSWLFLSVAANLSVLGFFKYFNFFAESLQVLLQAAGIKMNFLTLHVILPVGISFYTFQTMSYTIDVYRRRIAAEKNFFDLALYVSFFPQLIAGPIERSENLLPQIKQPRRINRSSFSQGITLVLWGLFKKVAVADNFAAFADGIFSSSAQLPGFIILLGVYAFAFQIYGDFSGYSDIARGISKLMGFELMVNFKRPYLAVSPSDFWHRWHISLSSWLRDYLYIPLGGNRHGAFNTYRNLVIVMLLGGMWHGAAWTFVLWGLYHALLLILELPARHFISMPDSAWTRALKVFWMFHLVCLGWVFFRAGSVPQAFAMLRQIFFDFRLGEALALFPAPALLFGALASAVCFLFYSVQDRAQEDRWTLQGSSLLHRMGFSLFIAAGIVIFGVSHSRQFIYFQF
jgi:alginate O-acetyltransferase complex protein AlgI